ncbi:MAG: hypothetical protein IJ475_02045 [Bacilli bacterium]|nr:hypothetical protein [Bacilli bacterium]
MRCPKCGAFLDSNKTVCFMCGANLTDGSVDAPPNVNQDNMQNNMSSSGFNNGFGDSNPFMNSNDSFSQMPNSNFVGQNGGTSFSQNNFNGGFNNPSVNANFNQSSVQNDVFKRKEEVKFNDDYKNIKIEDIKTDKDIFDFFSEHKKIIKFVLLVLLFAGLAFGGYKFYQYKTAPEEKVGLIGNLYFEVDDSFDQISTSAQKLVYSLSGDKGSECSITIYTGSTTTGDHVSEYFTENVNKLTPATGGENTEIDPAKVFKEQRDETSVNDTKWSRQYIYYRSDVNVENYNVLRYIYLTSMYKGYYYDISLMNNSNSNACNTALDSFTNSLEFVDKTKE